MKFISTYKDFLNENKNVDNFLNWFSGSKIVDDNGNPMVCYHASNNKFDSFVFSKKTRQTYYSDGFYFSNINNVSDYGVNVYKCYLNIKKPFIMNNENLKLADKYSETNNSEVYENDVESYCKYSIGYRADDNTLFKNNIIKDGYDGLIIEEFGIYIAFYPNQIKSVDNDGSFDINDDNIYS